MNAKDMSLFSPVCSAMQAWLHANIKEKFLINDGVQTAHLEGFLNACCQTEVGFLEMDISKFDKSQNEFVLQIELEIMRRFGILPVIRDAWKNCHTNTHIEFRKLGVRVPTGVQRKSGDPGTFLFNTLVTMTMAAYCIDMHAPEVKGGVFGGDDSLIIIQGGRPPRMNLLHAAQVFNLNVKNLDTSKEINFASKFLIPRGGYLHLIPDPLKFFFSVFKPRYKYL